MRRFVFALAAVFVLAAAQAAQASVGDIIVQREPGVDRSERLELREDAGVRFVSALSLERTELVHPAPGELDEALAALRADGDVVYAEPDQVATISRTSDVFWPSLWGLENTGQTLVSNGSPFGQRGLVDADIDAPEAWLRGGSEGAGVTVAVVDTGANADHVDLAGQLTGNPGEQGELDKDDGSDNDHNGFVDDHAGWDFLAGANTPLGDNTPQDGNGHGTHVSGTIAALGGNGNGLGVVGVAPKAKVMALRAFDDAGDGWMSDVADAFEYAGDLRVPIVNASLGGHYSEAVENAIAAHPGTLYVVAAGNAGANADVAADAYPCALALANVLCVGATDNRDQPAGFSNYGPTSVDLFAPGVNILSTWNGSPSDYVYLDGTSMAAPHVAGAAALVLAASPCASTGALRSALLSSVDSKLALGGLAVTCGRLNADAAISAIRGLESESTCPPPPEPTATAAPPVDPPTPVAPVVTPAPTPAALPAPVLTRLTVGGSLRTKKSKLRVSFSLNRAASVRFTVKRRGSKKSLAGWTRRGRAGANAVVLTRRLPTGRTLKPGAYTLAVGIAPTAKSSRLFRVR